MDQVSREINKNQSKRQFSLLRVDVYDVYLKCITYIVYTIIQVTYKNEAIKYTFYKHVFI